MRVISVLILLSQYLWTSPLPTKTSPLPSEFPNQFTEALKTPHSTGPRLEVRLSPRISLSPTVIHIWAEVKGMTPEWECPEVRWLSPGGTTATQLSDCDPSVEPETYWVREYAVSAPCNCEWTVELWRNDRLLARRTVEAIIG